MPSAVTYPEIAKMQTRAVMEAAIEVKQEKGYDIVPEIMIPLVGEKKELAYVKEVVVKTAEKVKAYYESDIQYKVGTMIEIPRAALLADEIAEEAEFFSFGTNDLTQMTFGFSRDDAGKFLNAYYDNKIYESDPFAKLDQDGVGQLVQIAAERGRKTRPISILESVENMVEIHHLSNSATKQDWIMYPALHSEYQLQDLQQHRL
jgi:pyruvate,orthophosphate dikinase